MRIVRTCRWVGIAVLLSAVTVPAALGMFFGKVPTKHNWRAEVEATDRQWREAQKANDIPAMQKLLSDDYLGISGTGQVLTKAQQISRMRNRTTNIPKFELSDEKVKLLGNIAIVTSEAELEGASDGHPIHLTFRSTRVYKRVGTVWQLTSFEATPEHPHHADPEPPE